MRSFWAAWFTWESFDLGLGLAVHSRKRFFDQRRI
jgi:hypothetical protein